MSYVFWFRHWYAARLCFGSAAGLLRLEELVRRFLISRETLSIRMLDDNLDPTPLLKEIRDDKVATIIIDANASVSYLILKKVSSQTPRRPSEPPTRAVWSYFCSELGQQHSGILSFSLSCTHLGNSGCSREGHAGLTNGKTIKQLARSPTGCTRLVVTVLPRVFLFLFLPFSALESWKREHCFVHVYQQAYLTLWKGFDRRAFCWTAPQIFAQNSFWSAVRTLMPVATTVSHNRKHIGWFERARWSNLSPSAICLSVSPMM